jgi:hypothetical protein
VLPGKIVELGSSAFADITHITGTIELPATVKSVGSYLFTKCGKITCIDMSKCVKLKKIEQYAFADMSGVTSVMLPPNLTSIGSNAFKDMKSLVAINFPKSVIDVGDKAFAGCTSLRTVVMEKSGTSTTDERGKIGNYAFAYLALNTIVIPDGRFRTIGESAFKYMDPNDHDPRVVTIGDGVEIIGSSAFESYSSHITLDMSSNHSIQTFGENCFKSNGAKFRDPLVFPSSTRTIAANAFQNCIVSAVTFNEGLTTIAYHSFSKAIVADKILVIPSTVERIGRSAFSSSSFNSVIISDSTNSKLTTIGDYALNIAYTAGSVIVLPYQCKGSLGKWTFGGNVLTIKYTDEPSA